METALWSAGQRREAKQPLKLLGFTATLPNKGVDGMFPLLLLLLSFHQDVNADPLSHVTTTA